MLHLLLNLTRPLFIPDTETTGVDPESSRIIELGFQQWSNNGMDREWRILLNPGIRIPETTTKLHGITDVDVVSRPRFYQIAESLARGFTNCDFAGKNVRFDLRIIAAELQRANVNWSYAGARIIDIDRLEALAFPRDLATLHAKYAGLPHDGAHGALSDVRASATVILKQLETHAFLPRDLDALHTLQWPGWLTADGKFRVLEGVPTIMFGKHKYRPMRDVPTDYYDYILTNNFPADVKVLVAKAKMGEFPE